MEKLLAHNKWGRRDTHAHYGTHFPMFSFFVFVAVQRLVQTVQLLGRGK